MPPPLSPSTLVVLRQIAIAHRGEHRARQIYRSGAWSGRLVGDGNGRPTPPGKLRMSRYSQHHSATLRWARTTCGMHEGTTTQTLLCCSTVDGTVSHVGCVDCCQHAVLSLGADVGECTPEWRLYCVRACTADLHNLDCRSYSQEIYCTQCRIHFYCCYRRNGQYCTQYPLLMM